MELSYKVKNKIKKTQMRNQFYNKILTTNFAIVQKGKK